MAFKSKIKPEDLKDLTEVNYIKLCQKEVKRAAKFGETGVVILSDYQFACGAVGTMMILGKMSGPLMKYYKQLKKDRSQEKDFAKGICYFEGTEGDNPVMRIALNDGKGKPAKMKKNGKKLFKKLGFETDIFKGELSLEEETLAEEELDQIEEQVDTENDDQQMKRIVANYKKAYGLVAKNLVPKLKDKNGITEAHYQLARKLLKLSKSLQDKLEEIGQEDAEKYKAFVEDVKAKEPKIIKIVANLKKWLSERTVEGSLEEIIQQLNEKKAVIDAKMNQLTPNLKAILGI
jgi:hypothetical protein